MTYNTVIIIIIYRDSHATLHVVVVFSIHPRDKQDVAQRLFMSGLQVAYHRGSAVVEGPRPVGVVQQASSVILSYATAVKLASREGFEVSFS